MLFINCIKYHLPTRNAHVIQAWYIFRKGMFIACNQCNLNEALILWNEFLFPKYSCWIICGGMKELYTYVASDSLGLFENTGVRMTECNKLWKGDRLEASKSPNIWMDIPYSVLLSIVNTTPLTPSSKSLSAVYSKKSKLNSVLTEDQKISYAL